MKSAAKISERIRSGELDDDVDDLLTTSKAAITTLLATVVLNSEALRNGRLRVAIEKIVETELLIRFFRTGKLALFSEVQPCSDEEYVTAALSMAQEISRYSKDRACEVQIYLTSLLCKIVYD